MQYKRVKTIDASALGYDGATFVVHASLPMGLYEQAVLSLRRLQDNATQDEDAMREIFSTVKAVLMHSIEQPDLAPSDLDAMPSDLAFWLLKEVMAGVAQPLGK